jgi:hypothetical protein
VDVEIQVLLTFPLLWGESSASLPGRFTLGERAHGTPRRGIWVGPSDGLDDEERRQILRLQGLKLRPFAVQPEAFGNVDNS